MDESGTLARFGWGAAAFCEAIAAPFGRVWRRAALACPGGEGAAAAIADNAPPPGLGGFGHSPGRAIDPHSVARFAELALTCDAAALLGEVDALRARGVSERAICLELLAPAARLLAQMWEREACDFLEVGMGLWRLQEVLRETAARPAAPGAAPSLVPRHRTSRRALFAPLPGDAHSFSALITSDVFISAGWHSEVLAPPRRSLLFERLAGTSFDVLGLTATRDCPSGALASLIRALRSVSANPQLIVLVGGRMITRSPGTALAAGADGLAADGPAALALAEALLDCPPALRAVPR